MDNCFCFVFLESCRAFFFILLLFTEWRSFRQKQLSCESGSKQHIWIQWKCETTCLSVISHLVSCCLSPDANTRQWGWLQRRAHVTSHADIKGDKIPMWCCLMVSLHPFFLIWPWISKYGPGEENLLSQCADYTAAVCPRLNWGLIGCLVAPCPSHSHSILSHGEEVEHKLKNIFLKKRQPSILLKWINQGQSVSVWFVHV